MDTTLVITRSHEKLSTLTRFHAHQFQKPLSPPDPGHWQFFRSSRRAVLGWFGARGSKAVLERVNQRYVDLGDWIVDGSVEARFVDRPVPEWGGEAILWICDRVFEFVFREERTEAEQKGIIDICIAMLSRQFREYSSAAELVTVDQETFWEAFGPYDPPPPHPGDR